MNTISNRISIYALGGLGEVGKNMYCLENENSLIIIDCGVRFPSADLPGVDYIIPDFTHLKNNSHKIKALFITHGHEDHIGGIPFLIQLVNIPVIYAPRLAAALIRSRLEEQRILEKTKIVEYDEKTIVNIPYFKVSFFRVTHSIPDSFGVVVDTDEGRIVSTGDFKIDLTPIGPDIALTKIAELGKEGVDLLLSDSTNAENEGYTPSEKNVLDSIIDIFSNTTLGRIIVSTFSSNISRIQQICEVAEQYKRKICILGRSMKKAVDISCKYGYINVSPKSFIEVQDLKLYKNSEILLICTGSQGEPNAALSRIANGTYPDVHIIPGDTVVFSSSVIPGNGIMIDHVVNLLTRGGADVITNSILNDIHSSGHPSKQELRLMIKLMKPKYFMPMHGEYRMLRLHAELAQTLGVPAENTFILDNGDSIQLMKHTVTKSYTVEHGVTYIDGTNLNGLNDSVLEDRKILNDDGMMAVVLAIDAKTNKMILDPIFYYKGVINQGSNSLTPVLRDLVTTAINNKLIKKTTFQELKEFIKTVVTDYLYKKTKRKPMVIPVVMSKNEL